MRIPRAVTLAAAAIPLLSAPAGAPAGGGAKKTAALPALPAGARLVLDEDWSGGAIDPKKWYVLRKHWGGGNNGVVPENVAIAADRVDGRVKKVLVCTAHGDRYNGDIVGRGGRKTRVGGVIVSRQFFAAGRFQVVMKIGDVKRHPGGPADPTRPAGTVPAIWTYGYRFVKVPQDRKNEFVPAVPLYNPHMPRYGGACNEYWSELDFPEFGKNGDFDKAMYNTFCQNRHEPKMRPVTGAADGTYHVFTTEWRTTLVPLPGVRDDQVVEHGGYWWVQDKSIPFDDYLGNPLKRRGKDDYAAYRGRIAAHWIDGKKVAENRRYVPAMAAQLNCGVWLPDWAGPAPWKTATVSFASVKVWQYGDEGDVRGVITGNIENNFDERGRKTR